MVSLAVKHGNNWIFWSLENDADTSRSHQEILDGLRFIEDGLAELTENRLEFFAAGVEYGFNAALGFTAIASCALWALTRAGLSHRLRNAGLIILAGVFLLTCLKAPDWLASFQMKKFEAVETDNAESQDS